MSTLRPSTQPRAGVSTWFSSRDAVLPYLLRRVSRRWYVLFAVLVVYVLLPTEGVGAEEATLTWSYEHKDIVKSEAKLDLTVPDEPIPSGGNFAIDFSWTFRGGDRNPITTSSNHLYCAQNVPRTYRGDPPANAQFYLLIGTSPDPKAYGLRTTTGTLREHNIEIDPTLPNFETARAKVSDVFDNRIQPAPFGSAVVLGEALRDPESKAFQVQRVSGRTCTQRGQVYYETSSEEDATGYITYRLPPDLGPGTYYIMPAPPSFGLFTGPPSSTSIYRPSEPLKGPGYFGLWSAAPEWWVQGALPRITIKAKPSESPSSSQPPTVTVPPEHLGTPLPAPPDDRSLDPTIALMMTLVTAAAAVAPVASGAGIGLTAMGGSEAATAALFSASRLLSAGSFVTGAGQVAAGAYVGGDRGTDLWHFGGITLLFAGLGSLLTLKLGKDLASESANAAVNTATDAATEDAINRHKASRLPPK